MTETQTISFEPDVYKWLDPKKSRHGRTSQFINDILREKMQEEISPEGIMAKINRLDEDRDIIEHKMGGLYDKLNKILQDQASQVLEVEEAKRRKLEALVIARADNDKQRIELISSRPGIDDILAKLPLAVRNNPDKLFDPDGDFDSVLSKLNDGRPRSERIGLSDIELYLKHKPKK